MFQFFKRKRDFKRGYEFFMRHTQTAGDIHVYKWLYADGKDFIAGMAQAANEIKASGAHYESSVIGEKRLIKGEQV